MTTIVAYDFLQVKGGAERVSCILANRLPGQLLVHSVGSAWARGESVDRNLCRLSSRPTSQNRVYRAISAWRSFETLSAREDIDSVIFSGHYAPLAWRAFPNAHRILYLHAAPLSPAFGLADGSKSGVSSIMTQAGRIAGALYKRRFLSAATSMHGVLANSEFTAAAFEKFTGVAAKVLPPPVDERFFELAGQPSRGDYWLSWARHEPMKRLDRLIDAFLRMPDQRLILAGDGSCTTKLIARARGAANIHFVGALNVDALVSQLRDAIGTIHISQNEPYGLVVAEAVAAGRWVIIGASGGTAEIPITAGNSTQIHGDPTAEKIIDAVRSSVYKSAGCMPPSRLGKLVSVDAFVSSIRGVFSGQPMEPFGS